MSYPWKANSFLKGNGRGVDLGERKGEDRDWEVWREEKLQSRCTI